MNLDCRKHLVVAAALCTFLTLASSPVLAATGPTELMARPETVATAPSLAEGAAGPAVERIQQQLKTLGYFTYPQITGYYGTYTTAAVRRFQAAYSLTVDGVTGEYTQRALHRAVTMLQVVKDTAQYTGIPYRWGGASPETGFDCSGFIYYMYKTHGLPLQRVTSEAYYTMGIAVDRAHLQPGDLVFFDTEGTASHMGIYTGGGKWISATSSKGIWTYTLDNLYWAPKYDGARRI